MLSLVRSQLRRRRQPLTSAIPTIEVFVLLQRFGFCSTTSAIPAPGKGKWLTLPPFAPPINAAFLSVDSESDLASVTALKWIRRCCPSIPESLVQKLFRLRQVRRAKGSPSSSDPHELIRISGKELLDIGDVIHLPVTVEEFIAEKKDFCFTEEEFNYVRSLQLHKDEAIIAVNKPSGLPVQGGVGIKQSMDLLAGACLKYDYTEPPRLVHRLDRESSGVLVLGRTQDSASLLHYIFRDKTQGAFNEMRTDKRILRKKYWALVCGSPRHSKGIINAPLRKINLENKQSVRIMLADHEGQSPSQHAVTEYEVVKSFSGFTWLKLCPLTGRKHQLRVHCAEFLGTPIVGDRKYGWSKHKKWQPFRALPYQDTNKITIKLFTLGSSPLLGLDLMGKSILEEEPSLHLHCRQMIVPNISQVPRRRIRDPTMDGWDFPRLDLVAPLPAHMQESWDALNFSY